jgi:hypothetical protein
MKSVKIIVLSVLFILSVGIFSASQAFATNPPNTFSVIKYENGNKIEIIYSTLDGGVVEIKINVYD